MNTSVLLVDDEPQVLNALEKLLALDHCSIFRAENGDDALDLLSKHDIAVLLCDLRMPGMSGVEVLIQARELSPHTVRIALTAVSNPDTILQCINEGSVSRFLLKPWNDEALRSIVKESITQHWMSHEVKRLSKMTEEQHGRLRRLNVTLEKELRHAKAALERSNGKLEKVFRDITIGLSDLMTLHADGLGPHHRLVTDISLKLAERCGLPFEEIICIEAAAMLHDIGKIAVNAAWLKEEQSALSDEQHRVIRRHPMTGHRLLKDIAGFHKVASLVRHHHERYDGQGFPDNLAGDAIPMGARILAVADSYANALHGGMGNAAPQSPSQVTAALQAEAGKALDPQLLEIFVNDIAETIPA